MAVLLWHNFLFAQSDSSVTIKNRYGVSILPSRSPHSYGIQIGPVGSESVCGYPYYKISNGLNIQIIGQGALWMFYPLSAYKKLDINIDSENIDTLKKKDALRAIHNGILISTLGPIDTRINGLCFSLFHGHGKKLNGVAINLIRNSYNLANGLELGLINECGRLKGVQIGILNFSKKTKGLQFGLWNVNEKRKLPLINWSFRD
jgi:hypothetical protein